MVKQIVVQDRTYNRLQDLKETYKAKGLGRIIDRCIDTYIDTYRNPKQIMINEFNTITDKYHYLFSNEEKEYLALFVALLRANQNARIGIARSLLRRVEEAHTGQTVIKDGI